jgi:mono/diheme cytochrome c family protein
MFKSISYILLGLALVSCQNAEELKKEQYFVEGFQLYTSNCANCHQADGKGLANLYPPLDREDILKDKGRLACIIKNGMNDTIQVNGKPFARPMPPNQKLTDLEMAEIISFIGIKWGKDSVYTSIDAVTKGLNDCGVNQGPTNL